MDIMGILGILAGIAVVIVMIYLKGRAWHQWTKDVTGGDQDEKNNTGK